MVIVAGHLLADPSQRDTDHRLWGVVEDARRVPGCLDFAITADLVDPGCIDVFARWESQSVVETFHGSGPSEEQGAAVVSASVADYDVDNVRPLT